MTIAEGFNLSLRVNFVDGGEESEGLIFTGSEGTMEITPATRDGESRAEGEGAGPHGRNVHRGDAEEYGRSYRKKYPVSIRRESRRWARRSMLHHMDTATATITSRISFDAVRTRQPVVEDAVFGFRAAGAALLSNLSYDEGHRGALGPECDEDSLILQVD